MTEHSMRYSRQVILSEIGEAGQQRLGDATVLVVGCGALGSNLASLLVRAGVGHLRLVDRDVLAEHNLHRQVLFDEQDVADGMPKAAAAAARLGRINSGVQVDARVIDVTARNIESLVDAADVVVDGTDNFETRYLVNDACVKVGVPWVYGGVIGTTGMTLVVRPGDGPCIRCVFPEAPAPGVLPTCDTVGILNTLPTAVASIQATEAIKLLLGSDDVSTGLLHLDLWDRSFRELEVKRDAACPTCGARDFEFLAHDDATAWVTTLCGRNAVQITPTHPSPIDLATLADQLSTLGRVTNNGLLIRVEIDDLTILIFPDARAVIEGTTDEARARSVYARYVGT